MKLALLIEPDLRDAESLRKLLAGEGVESVLFISRESAAAEIEKPTHSYDFAIIAWDIEILRKCRKRWHDMPIATISDRGEQFLQAVAADFGADDYLQKPVDAERIRVCLGE